MRRELYNHRRNIKLAEAFKSLLYRRLNHTHHDWWQYDIRRLLKKSKDLITLNPTNHSPIVSFFESAPQYFQEDIEIAYKYDPSAYSIDEIAACYPGVQALSLHRLAHCLYQSGIPIVPRIISEYAHSRFGIDIHPGAVIGRSVFIDHGTGIVIGETASIGDHCRIYQGVTLGAKSFRRDETGAFVKGELRHPQIRSDVTIYAGATLLGPITVGSSSTIGANVWLTNSVAKESIILFSTQPSPALRGGDGI